MSCVPLVRCCSDPGDNILLLERKDCGMIEEVVAAILSPLRSFIIGRNEIVSLNGNTKCNFENQEMRQTMGWLLGQCLQQGSLSTDL